MSGQDLKRMGELDYKALAPETYKALADLGHAVAKSGLDKALVEMVKIRASQINGCGYCLQLHLNWARRMGVDETKLDLLAVWHEAGIFTRREQTALAWTEALTRMSSAEVPDNVYADAVREFELGELAHLTAAIANINAWNRIAGGLHWMPPTPVAAPT